MAERLCNAAGDLGKGQDSTQFKISFSFTSIPQ